MHRLALTLGALVALVACGGGGSDDHPAAAVGPAPTSKQQAAQDVGVANAAISEVLSAAQGSGSSDPSTKSVGIHVQDAVAIKGKCAGGGSASITVAVSSTTPTSGTQSETVSYTLTAQNCTTSNGDAIDGGPLAITFGVTSNDGSGDPDAGIAGAAVKEHIGYSGAITVHGSVEESVSFNNLSIDLSVNVSDTDSGISESETLNGDVTVNGAVYTYSGDDFSYGYGG